MANEMRDRLVELIRNTQFIKCVFCESNGSCESDYCKAEIIADHLIENGVSVLQWISVNDKLPEDKQNILTIDSESKMEVCFYEKEWKGVFQQCGGLVKIFNITHWMPLPEPPKAEQKLKEMRGAEMNDCKYYYDEFCVNDKCPMCADFCPVPNDPDVCKWEDRSGEDDS